MSENGIFNVLNLVGGERIKESQKALSRRLGFELNNHIVALRHFDQHHGFPVTRIPGYLHGQFFHFRQIDGSQSFGFPVDEGNSILAGAENHSHRSRTVRLHPLAGRDLGLDDGGGLAGGQVGRVRIGRRELLDDVGRRGAFTETIRVRLIVFGPPSAAVGQLYEAVTETGAKHGEEYEKYDAVNVSHFTPLE